MDPKRLATSEGAALLTCVYHAKHPATKLPIGNATDGIPGAWALFRQLPIETQRALLELGGSPFTAGNTDADPMRQLQAGGPVFHRTQYGAALPPDECFAGRDVVFIGATPLPPDECFAGRDVVFIGATPPVEELKRVAGLARTTTILSREIPARDVCTALTAAGIRLVWHEGRSTAQMAWDWATEEVPRPAVIDYLGDYTLYRYQLPNTFAINMALHIEGMTCSFEGLTAFTAACRGESIDAAFIERGMCYLGFEKNTLAMCTEGAARPALVRARSAGEENPREYCVLTVNADVEHPDRDVLAKTLAALTRDHFDFVVVWTCLRDRVWDEICADARTEHPTINLTQIAPDVIGAAIAESHDPRSASFSIAADSFAAFATPLDLSVVAMPPRSIA
jgi:hypothetical protein